MDIGHKVPHETAGFKWGFQMLKDKVGYYPEVANCRSKLHYWYFPAKITYSATQYIELTYDAAGRKWKKTTVNGAVTTEKYYFGPVEYNGSNLEALYHEEGRAVPSGGSYEYQYAIRDHLGSTRVMFKMVSGTATLIQVEAQRRSRTPDKGSGRITTIRLGWSWMDRCLWGGLISICIMGRN